jgi:hypothetical protein
MMTKEHLFSKRTIVRLLCFIGLLIYSATGYGQAFLEVPVRLDVDKGDLNDVVVKVQKDGKDAFTQSGASKMRFKLDYNKKYTLIFTKPGYITKTIEFNTSAPSERIAQKFEPYKIGVKIYKQGEESNNVFYNQPVARIKFDRTIDEFNFDTDYSKSILSALDDPDEKKDTSQTAKTEINPQVTAKAPEPVAENKASAVIVPSSSSPSMLTASTTNDPTVETKKIVPVQKSEPDPVQIEPDGSVEQPPAAVPEVAKESPPATAITANEEHNKNVTPIAAQEAAPAPKPAAELPPKVIASAANEESAKKASPKQEEEKPKITAHGYAGVDPSKSFSIPASGSDRAENVGDFTESEKITRQDIVEKNRVITVVRVIRGAVVNEYSRVNYSWGGQYFFKNNTMSIPENLFVQWTGVHN